MCSLEGGGEGVVIEGCRGRGGLEEVGAGLGFASGSEEEGGGGGEGLLAAPVAGSTSCNYTSDGKQLVVSNWWWN